MSSKAYLIAEVIFFTKPAFSTDAEILAKIPFLNVMARECAIPFEISHGIAISLLTILTSCSAAIIENCRMMASFALRNLT